MYDVKHYGITGDGKTDNTQAIQSLIDRCHEEGGSIIVFGRGIYMSGPLYLRSNVELRLESNAVLKAIADAELYENFVAEGFKGGPECNAKYFICAFKEDNVAISGSGTIDGSGAGFFDKDKLNPRNNSLYDIEDFRLTRPARMMMFYKCTNLSLENASFANASGWTFWLHGCEDVRIRGIRIDGDWKVPHHDGIDIDSCRRVTVSDCIISSGDDCIVLRAIQAYDDEPCICEDVTVSNCVLHTNTQGVRVGCPSDNIVRNCILNNLRINSQANGINFDCPSHFLSKNGFASLDAHDIMFSNIIIDCGRHPLKMNIDEGIKIKAMHDIMFSNMTMTAQAPVLIHGNRDCAIKNISLNNMTMNILADNAIDAKNCCIKMNNVECTNKTGG